MSGKSPEHSGQTHPDNGRFVGRATEGKTLGSPVHKRLVLGFDAGCSACSDVAERIEDRLHGELAVRNLWDPEVLGWRAGALGEDAPWAPTLFEIEDEEVVQAWTGWRMGLNLSRLLGPVATWQVMRALGETNQAPRAAGTAGQSRGITRGQLLKGGVGGAVVAAGVLSGTDRFVSTASAAENATSPPASSGTPAEQRRAKAIVRSSEEFKDLASRHSQRTGESNNGASNPFDFSQATVNIDDGFAAVIVPAYYQGSDPKGTVGTFFVNLQREVVGSYRSLELATAESNELNVSFYEDGQLLERTSFGEDSVVTEDGQRTTSSSQGAAAGQKISYQEYLAQLSQKQAGSDQVASEGPQRSTQVSCGFAISTICGFGVSGNCYAIAVFAGIASAGIAGFSLAAVCAAIGIYGCGSAKQRLCG